MPSVAWAIRPSKSSPPAWRPRVIPYPRTIYALRSVTDRCCSSPHQAPGRARGCAHRIHVHHHPDQPDARRCCWRMYRTELRLGRAHHVRRQIHVVFGRGRRLRRPQDLLRQPRRRAADGRLELRRRGHPGEVSTFGGPHVPAQLEHPGERGSAVLLRKPRRHPHRG